MKKRKAGKKTKAFLILNGDKIMDRVKECKQQNKDSCKGCKYSYNPALFDGGCLLHIEARRQQERKQNQ